MKIDSVWGNPDTELPPAAQTAFRSAPQHRSGGKKYPEGGNEVFVDCSARFCRVETMDQFTTWAAGSRELWFYQNVAEISNPSQLNSINTTLKWKKSDQ